MGLFDGLLVVLFALGAALAADLVGGGTIQEGAKDIVEAGSEVGMFVVPNWIDAHLVEPVVNFFGNIFG